ncbi:MAG: GFA family protein [Polyangiaceae bacterium]
MAKRTFKGSCHCGRVKFEAEIDLAQGTSKCNCTSCWKRRWWSARCAPEDFRPLSGEAELVWYRQGTTTGRGGFCKHCGVKTYVFVEKADWNPTEYVSINVATLDNLESDRARRSADSILRRPQRQLVERPCRSQAPLERRPV